ncbi:MAG: hypothetical protein Q9186_002534 [Xanthomendoza sp. 1 TL-2023]
MTDVPDQQEMWKTTVVKIALSHAFLLNEVLAIAALHLVASRSERHDFWQTRSMELQSHALIGFNSIEKEVDETNCVPILLFSALLGAHLLGDRSRTQNLTSHSEYLDHVVNCVGLMRNVRSLVLKQWTATLRDSSIGALMMTRNPQPPYHDVPNECRELTAMVRQSDLGVSSIEAYDMAIDRLLWLFDLAEVPSKVHDTPRSVFAWPVQLRDEFMSLLNRRQPEALIILAYYGVILHFYRKAWCIGNSGACLIRAIDALVGNYWSRWLQWPMQMIAST